MNENIEAAKQIMINLHNIIYEERYLRLKKMGYDMKDIDGIDIEEKRKQLNYYIEKLIK